MSRKRKKRERPASNKRATRLEKKSGSQGRKFSTTGELSFGRYGKGYVKTEYAIDIFIQPEHLAGYFDGDIVDVDVVSYRGRRPVGRLTALVKRQKRFILGRLKNTQTRPVLTLEESDTDYPVTNAKTFPLTHCSGQIALAAIPQKVKNRGVAIIQLIDEQAENERDFLGVVCGANIPFYFPEPVEKEAAEFGDTLKEKELQRRKDYRDVYTVTIDGATAKDLDDAISVKKKKSGGYTLAVHIADVSHYVTRGSALDREAYERGTSVYLGNRVVPMLPTALSNHLCSLNPHVDRLTMTAEMDLSASGELQATRVYESVIHSDARLTYDEVNKDLKKEKFFKLIYELSQTLFKKRIREGSLDMNVPEGKVVFDKNEHVKDIIRVSRSPATGIIEEFMLVANVAVAAFLKERGPALYRVHDLPSAERLETLKRLARLLFEDMEISPNVREFYLHYIETVRDTPRERFLNYLLLRSMAKAEYSVKNIGHFGLAFPLYTHFTSPIRRYPDLVVHRLLKSAIGRGPARTPYNAKELDTIAAWSSSAEERAVRAERGYTQIKRVRLAATFKGKKRRGAISAFMPSGFFVELDDCYVEGLVKRVDLKDDFYEYIEDAYCFLGCRTGRRIIIGDPVTVRIANVNFERREVDMDLIEFLKD